MRSKFPSFSFTYCAFGVVCKKSLPNLSPRYYSMFTPRNFIILWILCFMFRMLILMKDFELILMKDKNSVLWFFFLLLFFGMRMASGSSNSCWKDYPFSIALTLLLCYRSVDYSLGINFWTLYYLLLICLSVNLPMPHCVDYFSFTVSLKVWYCQSSNLTSFFFSTLHWLLPPSI